MKTYLQYCLMSLTVLFLSGCSLYHTYDITSLPQRQWSAPQTSDAPQWTNIAHEQLTQNSPLELQEQVWAFMWWLDGVSTGASRVSVPWARAIYHNHTVNNIQWSERAHLHPSYDGSMHISWNPTLLKHIVDAGRWEYHPRNSLAIMLYWPRDAHELNIIKSIIQQLYNSSLD